MRHIMVATDGSESADRAVDVATELTAAVGGDLNILHVSGDLSGDPAQLWAFYLQLVEVEQAFKELTGDLAIRPIYHQTDERIEAHILMCSRDCSWFGHMADWCEQDLRRLRVRTAVAFHDSCSSREPVVAATRIAA
jgi:hypothetical protein